MDCTQARHLIDQGVVPGPQTSLSTQLGFHLAQCPACRAYRAEQSTLLASLLLDQASLPSAPPSTIATHSAIEKPIVTLPQEKGIPEPRKSQWSRAIWLAGMIFTLALVGAVVWVGGILLRTQQNIASYVVATPRGTDVPTPQAVAGEIVPNTAGQLIGVQPLEQQQASATILPSAEQTVIPEVVESTATPQPSKITQPTARRVVTATPQPTEEPTVPAATATPELQPPPPGEAFTVLILGNDLRPGETGVPRTDVVMLARIDPQRGRAALLSFPRDMWVTIPGYGESRINAAYVWGEIYNAEGGGLGLARATVSNLIGRPIDYTMMVDFTGFIGLIDSIGGVTVNVEKELDDPSYPTMDYGYMHAYFAPGPQHMDGNTALIYSRIRHPDSDFARVMRQQAVLVAIGQRLQERGDFQNLFAADAITGALRGYVQTDMPQERILGALWALRSLNPAQVEHLSFDEGWVSFGIGSDRYAILPLPGAAEDRARRLYGE